MDESEDRDGPREATPAGDDSDDAPTPESPDTGPADAPDADAGSADDTATESPDTGPADDADAPDADAGSADDTATDADPDADAPAPTRTDTGGDTAPTADWRTGGPGSTADTGPSGDTDSPDDPDDSSDDLDDTDSPDDPDDSDTDPDAGGLTRVDPPDDPPRPEKPPRDDGDADDAGGLRRVDDDSTAATPSADDAHPAERHDPVTGVDGTPPAGHADGAPTPGETAADADTPTTDGVEAGADRPASAPSAPSEPVGADLDDDGPPDDEEMPLSAHIEEMIRRLAVVVIAAGLATAFTFPVATRLINAMWYGVLPANVPPPTLYGPLEKLLAEIKVASLGGILIALPVVVYEVYLFMRPGLYPDERRYFLAAVPTSLVLGSVGMAFAYFLVLPLLFRYFITYSESAVDALPFGLQVTFDLFVSLLGAFALVFQIPLLIMLAVMIGVVTRRWLERQRLLFWGLFVGVGFFISLGDATGTAPLIIGATMIALFEGTLALLRWTGRN